MSHAIHSAVEAVTVFRAGALVTRSAQLTAADGYPAQVRLTGLPLALDDASLRVAIESDEGDPPIATDLRVCLEVPETDLSLAPPTDERLDEARVALELAKVQVANLSRRRVRIQQLVVRKRARGADGEMPIVSPSAGRDALDQLRASALEQLDEKIFACEDDLKKRRDTFRRLEADKELATTARQARADEVRKTVVVKLGGDATAKNARLSLDYRVPGARWAPSYAVRFDRELSSADLTVRALVRQGTGEDWSNVRMRLSTASWQAWSELPKLKALRIGRRQPPSPPKWRPAPTGADALFADFDAASRAAPDHGGDTSPPPAGATTVSTEIDAGLLAALQAGAGAAEQAKGQMPIPEPVLSPAPMEPGTLGGSVDFEGEATGSFPMADMAMPPPQAMPVAKSRSMFGGRGGAPPPAAMANNLMRASKRAAPPPPPPEPVPDEDLFDFGALRMMGAGAGRRGKLVPQSRHERYLTLLQQVSVTFDVLQIVTIAEGRASEVDASSPPPRHRFAQTEDGFDFAYEVIGRAEVPSDGRDRSLPLASESSRAMPRYVAVPRETQDVFREVGFENPLTAPLLAGPIDVYVAGTYLTTVDLKTTASRGEVRLGLGVEQAIKISRNVRYEEQAAGLIRGSRDLVHAIEIELANNLARDATVEVRERVPVAQERDDDVKVTIDEVAPSWEPYEQDDEVLRGGYYWRVRVPGSDKKMLSARYTIRIKSGEELIGGNRREA